MNISGNTILITGGGSGIGLALAVAFKKLGNEVIVSSRTHTKLTHAQTLGLQTFTVDMMSEKSIKEMAMEAIRKFPALNIVIHNAGIMVNEKVSTSDTSKTSEDTILTNLLGPIRLTNALLPHLLSQKSSVVMTVTSGLAFAPLAMTPSYCASKAAIHSYTESLRLQLQGTSVEVKELVPPYVQTTLMGERQALDPNAMPLDDYIHEVMEILKTNPEAKEILVRRVLPQRTSSYQGPENYQSFFTAMNERLMNVRKDEWSKL